LVKIFRKVWSLVFFTYNNNIFLKQMNSLPPSHLSLLYNHFMFFSYRFPSFYPNFNPFPMNYFRYFLSIAKTAQLQISEALLRKYDFIKKKTQISLNHSILTFDGIESLYNQISSLSTIEKKAFTQVQTLFVALSTILELLLKKRIENLVFFLKIYIKQAFFKKG